MSYQQQTTRGRRGETLTTPTRRGLLALHGGISRTAIALLAVVPLLVATPPATASIAVNRTITAAAVGTPQANCAGLRVLLGGLTPAATEPYLMRLEPGVYDCGSSTLTVPEFVDLEGSGRGVSRLLFGDVSVGLRISSTTEVRRLAVESQAGCAVEMGGSSRLTHVDVRAEGDSGYCGVRTTLESGFVILEDVAIVVEGQSEGGLASGVRALDMSGRLAGVNVTVDSDGWALGVYIQRLTYSSSTPAWEIRDTTVDVSGGTATGIHAADAAVTLLVHNTTVHAVATTYQAIATSVNHASARIVRSTLGAVAAGSGGINRAWALEASGDNDNTAAVEIHSCDLHGDDATIRAETGSIISVGGSHLSGGPVDPIGGTVTCAGVWDESFVFLPTSCP